MSSIINDRDGKVWLKYEKLSLSGTPSKITVWIITIESEHFNKLNKSFRKWKHRKCFIHLSWRFCILKENKTDLFLIIAKSIDLKYILVLFLEHVNPTNWKRGCKNKLIPAHINLCSFPDLQSILCSYSVIKLALLIQPWREWPHYILSQ